MAKSPKLLRIFSDESGSPDQFNANCHNHGERVYTVASVIIRQKEYLKFKKSLNSLKHKYEKYLCCKEIKSRSIRRSNPNKIDKSDPPDYDFWKYPEGQEQYELFCSEMKEIVKNTDFKIISVNTDKIIAQKLYPHCDILTTLMMNLWERIFIHLYLEKIKQFYIIFDPTGRIDDETMIKSYKDFCKDGTWFISKKRLSSVNLKKSIYKHTSESSMGIQLADYCAYPIKRFVGDKVEGSFFQEVIKPKLCQTVRDIRTNKRVMMGIKISLNR